MWERPRGRSLPSADRLIDAVNAAYRCPPASLTQFGPFSPGTIFFLYERARSFPRGGFETGYFGETECGAKYSRACALHRGAYSSMLSTDHFDKGLLPPAISSTGLSDAAWVSALAPCGGVCQTPRASSPTGLGV